MWLSLLALLLFIFLYKWYRQNLKIENLSDKYVLVTGCDSGFGNQLAKNLDKLGMRVLATCLTEQGAENLKKETSSRLQTVILDIANSTSVQSAAKWVFDVLGERDLWGLVNNAGTGMPGAPNEWLSREDFARVLNVNLLGPIDVTLRLLPLIRKSKGRIVNVSSIVGRVTICGGGYCISKFGVEAFSDSLRREMKPFGVQVSIIEPGYFYTGLNNMQFMKDVLRTIWKNVHPEVRYSYGQKYFEHYVHDLESTFISLANTDLTPVTDCMEHALTAVYPKTRYSAGWDAKLFFIPLSYVPTALADYLLTRTAPTPAH
ncbi:retinol dehydrogenase 7-like [Hyla sarda]|uniref:retinol dehydrogenase 7-like n=1 Tax=Hyla sarda TaxID=327740 RepID=UPI0024C40967|nr:retinol dehydrogenase 7-like [Hyla sarda]XP_056418475.1 retinol dehydrogenase 7-like [Hyla sarda]XP_056418476.1 retinol dehydrogenase 7-like [Hyla sarda]XP_056418477.1 retinol dehydrogenase 7-like [Hyla sarda]